MALYSKRQENFYEIPPNPAVKYGFAACFILFVAAVIFAMAAPDDMAGNKSMFFGWVCLLIAAAAVAAGIYGYRANSAAGSWTRVRGVIVRSGVLTYEEPSADTGGTFTVHRPDIVYEYTYGGGTHQGDRVAIQRVSSSDPAAARKTADKYPVGRDVQLYVNPEAPEQAMIEFDPKQPRMILLISFGMAAGFALFGMVMICSVVQGW